MSYNLLYQCRIDILCCHHRNTSMACIVGLVRASDAFHDRSPIGIVVVAICKVTSIGCVQQILSALFIPLLEYGIGLVMYRNHSDATAGLAMHNVETMLVYVNILTFQVEQF